MIHSEAYWSQRYESGEIQWDAGTITTPLKTYFDQLTDKTINILIPGCGNAHEASYLWHQGFKNIYLADLSAIPLQHFKQNHPDFPDEQLLHIDFFEIQDQYDLIVEQTFFCALHPTQRAAYVQQMLKLLRPGGKLMGVLFDDPLFDDHPPYGGNKAAYLPLFQPYFELEVFDNCHNSIPPRTSRELFVLMRKPEA